MTSWFNSFDNSMRAHICHDVNVIVFARRIGRKYVIVNQLLLLLFFFNFSLPILRKNYHRASHQYFKLKFVDQWNDIFLRVALNDLFLVGAGTGRSCVLTKNRFFNFCDGKKNIGCLNTVRLPTPCALPPPYPPPPFLPKQLKMLQKVTKVICPRSII